MDRSRPAAERVRHILRAMEQSIDAARQRRLHTHDHHDGRPGGVETAKHDSPTGGEEPVTRLKARPKRPSHLSSIDGGPSFRSRAS